MKKLTTKQKRFSEFFDGNGVQACRDAGYKGNDQTLAVVAKENLRKPHIRAAIDAREQKKTGPLIMTREQRQALWTKIALDETEATRDQLRASELLGKSQADFVDRVQHEGIPTVIVKDLTGE